MGKFATTTQALFGHRASQMGDEPTEVIIMAVKATIALAEEGNTTR